MKKFLLLAFFTFTALFGGGEVFGQTYTYNRTNSGCDGNWQTAACWNPPLNNTGPTGCTRSTSVIPPTSPTGCEVNIIINGDVTFGTNVAPLNMTFGGNFKTLTINPNSKLTITGDIIIQASKTINFVTNGGIIDVLGDNGIIIQSGTNANRTNLNFSGNGLGVVRTKKIDLNNNVNLNINSGGSLISSGQTSYAGQGININVDGGFFRTASLSIAGNQNKLNMNNSGVVVIDGDVKFVGNDSGLDVKGSSEIEIGGNVQTQPNSSFKIEDGSTVRMCGTAVNSPSEAELKELEKKLKISIGGCRILPVEILYFESSYNPNQKSTKLSWATAKEVSNSHFEIERSDKGINDFKKVGEVDGMGWKDTVTEYEFIDDMLPLSGGNILYRIKQVDFDGKSTYSKVLSVRVEGVHATQGVWRAFPNPTMGDQLRISLLDRTQYDQEQITFRIVHPNLITQGITVNSENEMNDQLAKLIPRAPKGVLVVEIQWGQKVEHIKVLKK